MHDKKVVDMFTIPVFEFKFKDHELYRQQWIDALETPGMWRDKTLNPSRTFKVSSPNLHKNEIFNPLRVFFLECLYSVVNDSCGLRTDMGITSMWATKHEKDGFHHSHTHGNTFFAGVYYLDSDSDKPAGTEFNNVMADFYSFNRIKTVSECGLKSNSFHSVNEVPFERGKLIIFPGWLRHTTRQNPGEMRYIFGWNTMPIGLSNNDYYDRYHYADFRNSYMLGDDLDDYEK